MREISIVVHAGGESPDDVQALAYDLQDNLLGTDVDNVRPTTIGKAPDGARAGESLAIGALTVTLGAAAVDSVVAVVMSWLRRQPADVQVELEINGHRLTAGTTNSDQVARYLTDQGRES